MENNIAFQVENGQFTYRVAAIILYEDKILLVQNKEYDCFYTVGGKVKFGESTEEAILREVAEETQCKYEIERLAFIQECFFHMGNSEHHEVIFYYCMKENEKKEKKFAILFPENISNFHFRSGFNRRSASRRIWNYIHGISFLNISRSARSSVFAR